MENNSYCKPSVFQSFKFQRKLKRAAKWTFDVHGYVRMHAYMRAYLRVFVCPPNADRLIGTIDYDTTND